MTPIDVMLIWLAVLLASMFALGFICGRCR
jgi:hypothetical protein